MNRNTKIVVWSSAIIAAGGIFYFFYSMNERKKLDAIYERSIEDMNEQYQIFK